MDALKAITERRAINFFDPGRNVPEETLQKIIETANLAPSSFNLQPWHIIVVRDAEKKKILRQCAMNQPKVEEAPVVLIVVADPYAVEEHLERVLEDRLKKGYLTDEGQKEAVRKAVKKLYGEPDSKKRIIFATKNTAFFAMTLMIAARAFGLETHPMDGFDEDCVKKEFAVPEDKIIPCLIAMGYPKPDLKLLERPMRRPVNEFIHDDLW
ncbi:nitroreductase family protein [Thermodesulforhabdus norvegica]|uniref:Nitroreductase n=1 Tax=Thermodesulforhabdus norvegica TaxID=39841 RepID=A0A1I4UHX8_9BACT|nr:nitroreductase family protein [Thermodesulforhabdus norvegica]SFM88515.1 Nitroreductase [Thermodesulforhabdus norvegica]